VYNHESNITDYTIKMKKLHIESCRKFLTQIIFLTFIVLATSFLIYYAKGYRINFVDQKIVKTGVLSLETQPRRAHFYITEDFKGRTSRTISSIPAGTYNLEIWLDGYHNLLYEIEIIAEKSAPITAFLFKELPDHEIVSNLEGTIVSSHKNKDSNTMLILIKEENEETTEYQLLKYQTDLRFWQLRNNLQKIFEFSTYRENQIEDFFVSPNNNFAILSIEGSEDGLREEVLSSGIHVLSIETQTVFKDLKHINKEGKWSRDSLSFIWLEENELRKLNIEEAKEEKVVYKTPKNIEIIYFDTDQNGDIYMLYKENDNKYVTLAKMDKEGGKTSLLRTIYYQDAERFLEPWKNKEYLDCPPFKNSPQSTLLVGQPNKFWISLETGSIIIQTDYAAYRYDIKNDRYSLINPYPTEILNFSPDHHKLSFIDLEREKLGIFIFDREIANYTIKLGSYYMTEDINTESCSDFAWHRNSENIYYICNSSLYAADIRGFNNIQILPYFGNQILTENAGKVVTILTNKDISNTLEKLSDRKQKAEFEKISKHISETESIILELTVN
jgi:hypothetical protein